MDSIMQNNSDILESTGLKVVRLSNQLLVGNFSSPHAFTFDDGTVLSAVSDYNSMRLKVNFNETIVEDKIIRLYDYNLMSDVRFTREEDYECIIIHKGKFYLSK